MVMLLLIATPVLLYLGYLLYTRRILNAYLPPERRHTMPSRRYQDGVDFLPTPAGILLGYQFISISFNPILGPIIAIQFGWFPVLLWLVLGLVFAGWIQDYAVTLISARNAGASLGKLIGGLVSPASRTLLLIFIYVYLLLSVAALAVIIAPLFSRDSVTLAILILLGTGFLIGHMMVRWRLPLPIVTLAAILLAVLGIFAGSLPWAQAIIRSINNLGGGVLNQPWGNGELTGSNLFWGFVLLSIAYAGAVLPVWRFTLPANFTASLITIVTMGAAVIGILVGTLTGQLDTEIRIPAIVGVSHPQLGPLWPLLFVTVSSGAVSGWHALVASFSTSRLLDKERDALPVTAGASFLETCLALLSIVFAVTVGVTAGRYAPDQNFRLVAGPASVFVSGLQVALDILGFPAQIGGELGVILLTLMTLAVMQLLMRFLRMAGSELLGERLPLMKIPGMGAFVGLLIALFLIVFGFWQHLWVLFGGANQVLAGVALMIVTTWLARNMKPHQWTFLPAVFLMLSGVAALLYVSIYRILYQSVFLAYRQGAVIIFGNVITALVGICLVLLALVLFMDSLKVINLARSRIAGNSKEPV